MVWLWLIAIIIGLALLIAIIIGFAFVIAIFIESGTNIAVIIGVCYCKVFKNCNTKFLDHRVQYFST